MGGNAGGESSGAAAPPLLLQAAAVGHRVCCYSLQVVVLCWYRYSVVLVVLVPVARGVEVPSAIVRATEGY